MLADLPLRLSYRSDADSIITDFYVPCLKASKNYDRAVGFFSSSALSLAAKGLHAFLSGGGKMRLVASPLLSPEDIAAITSGYLDRRSAEAMALASVIDQEFPRSVSNRLGLLAWLVAHDRLDVKIAVRKADCQNGIYHEKVGVFHDGRDFVAFAGSPNESASGLVSNFECVDVFCSWKPADCERATEKVRGFERLWSDHTPSLEVYPFPEAARKSLLRHRIPRIPDQDPELVEEEDLSVVRCPHLEPSVPDDIVLRDYQILAIENWLRAKGNGTLKMATGSGKTVVALAAACRAFKAGLKALVVVTPYRHLVSQWSEQSQRFSMRPIRCCESRSNWQAVLHESLLSLGSGTIPFLCAVTTNATFASSAFQDVIRFLPAQTVIVGDEAHNLGADRLTKSLPTSIPYRMALSATPERWFDDEGTEDLLDYFGPVMQPEFTLADAIRAGALVPYRFHPSFVELTEDESEEYVSLSRSIGRAIARSPKDDLNFPQISYLLFRRARLVGCARNKLSALRDIMAGRLETSHTLFYCGDGRVEEPATGEIVRHLEAVCRLLGYELGYRVTTYTAENSMSERDELRRRLDNGELQGLVAIRCLDEGVDIPPIRTAFILASSTNPRQFIQRRGRVLRRSPGKTSADLFDFIVVPPEGPSDYFEYERRLLRREIARYIEFADLAINSGEARGRLVDLQKKFGLLDV